MLGSETHQPPSPRSRVKMSSLKKTPIMEDYPSAESAEPSTERISGILHDNIKTDYSPPRLWLAITALVLAIIVLIVTIIFAFVIIPNNECDCPCATTTTDASALTTDADARSQVTEYTLDNGATVIRNVTHRYIYENETEYVVPNQSCPTNTMGIINVGMTYEVGGYFKWTLEDDYPDFYPLPDVHASVGDSIFFVSDSGSSQTEDVWLVTEDLYNGMHSLCLY